MSIHFCKTREENVRYCNLIKMNNASQVCCSKARLRGLLSLSVTHSYVLCSKVTATFSPSQLLGWKIYFQNSSSFQFSANSIVVQTVAPLLEKFAHTHKFANPNTNVGDANGQWYSYKQWQDWHVVGICEIA